MHRSLLLPEIFRRILDYLEIMPYDNFYAAHSQPRSHNASIARLARTCHTFLEPCLDVLWKKQLTLAPLVKTLPEDSYEELVKRDISQPLTPRYFEIIILRPLHESDWSRFDYYASRIKALGYYNNEYADQELFNWSEPSSLFREYELRRAVVSRLCLYRRGRWLLPNLTHLRWNIYDAAYTDHIPTFLGPNLTSIAFALHTWDVGPPLDPLVVERLVVRALDFLADLCPTLTELEMYPDYPSDIVVSSRKFAYQCRKLNGYHVSSSKQPTHDQSILLHLAAKPHLRKVFLNLDSNTAELIPLLSSPPIYHPFPTLQMLYLKVSHIRHCISLFEAMQHCRLYSFILEITNQPPACDVLAFFEALRRHCAKYTLHVLSISQQETMSKEDAFPPDRTAHSVDITTLSPILDFPNIRIFTFDVPLLGWLADEDYRAIAVAWPGLVGFSFLETWGTTTTTPGTWEGIASLIQLCPLLTELHLVFDTTRNLDAAYKLDGCLDSRIRQFDVVDSILPEDPGIFAKALFSLAPRVAFISADGPGRMMSAQDGPLPFDSYAYLLQVDKIMCQFRRARFGDEYTTDIWGAKETADLSESQSQEWNPWA